MRTKLSPPQLAKKWGVASAKIVAFIHSGELRAINMATSRSNRPRYMIDVADIAAFEAARVVVPNFAPRKLRRPSAGEVEKFF